MYHSLLVALFHSLRLIKEVFFSSDDLTVLHIDSRNAAGDVAHDFVVDGATGRSDFFNGYEALALLAKENDFVAGVDTGFTGNVDHALVHADRAYLWNAMAMVQHIYLAREDTRIAISIAYGEGSNFTPRCGPEMATIADGGARVYQFDMGNATAQGHDGFQVKWRNVDF